MEAWAVVLVVLAAIIVAICIIVFWLKYNAKKQYYYWLSNPSTPLDVDSFVNAAKNPPKYFKIWFGQKLSIGNRKPSESAVKLASTESPYVGGLQVTQRADRREKKQESDDDGNANQSDPNLIELGLLKNRTEDELMTTSSATNNNNRKKPLVIGTIRMGFGHHRIAYAACSWALAEAEKSNTNNDDDDDSISRVYFHDLLNIDSEEADLIKATDALYSKMSRITSNMGGIFEKIWGSCTLSGDSDALRISALTAVHLRPLFQDLPLDTPIIASHCWVALAAVAAGFTNVINLVIDNHAQWFCVVPGCLNLVQGPVNYQNFLKMGIVDPSLLELAGHWIPRDLVVNVPDDCQRRISRLTNTTSYQPRRILIPVGGAGAQRKFICQFVKSLKVFLQEEKVHLFLNAGDHVHMKKAFQDVLQEIGVEEYNTITTMEGVLTFRDSLLSEGGEEPTSTTPAVTLFSFDEYFPAVATTDILSRVADVLACKPSELAFYPVPKLMIRRVGDHEQYSALRAAELGDGTLEARELEDCITYMKLFCDDGSHLLKQMNTSIMENNKQGVYDGCKRAVQAALERSS